MPASLNRVILMGTINSEPSFKQVAPQENALCFQILSNTQLTNARGEPYEEKLTADVEVPANLAQEMQSMLHRGADIFIAGRLRFIAWQDPMTGRRRNNLVIRAEQIQAGAGDAVPPVDMMPPTSVQDYPDPSMGMEPMDSPF